MHFFDRPLDCLLHSLPRKVISRAGRDDEEEGEGMDTESGGEDGGDEGDVREYKMTKVSHA